MADPLAEARVGAEALAGFAAAGAEVVAPACLQPADLLLDLYGEDIRSRAYISVDPVDGEVMLRPDFTVPVVKYHLGQNRTVARYAYAGPVWRRQGPDSALAREYWQAGYEVLGEADAAAADAEVFARIADALQGTGAVPVTGDLGILFAAIDGLDTTEARKAALRRHVWRPVRFERLIDRFAGTAPFDCDTRALPDLPAVAEPEGRRDLADVSARLAALVEERRTPPLAAEEVRMFRAILANRGTASDCLAALRRIEAGVPGISASLDAMERRLSALDAAGFAPADLRFDGSFGRRTMEYYDGFVFAFHGRDANDGRPLATGGRYDALTGVLGGGAAIPAVGGVVRPGLVVDALGGAS